ncbi:MAG: hypothetical protein Q9169_002519 [Polycauliona sp. 2 TL-2023]
MAGKGSTGLTASRTTRTRSQSAPKACWESLPQEIRIVIMEAVVQDDERCAIRYATVSRKWQQVVEPMVFRQLKLTHSRLANFAKVTQRQRILIKHMWLCIGLQAYGSSISAKVAQAWSEATIKVVGEAISNLFSILSAWEPSGTLMLDISAHSLSDSQHYIDPLRSGSNVFVKASHAQKMVIMKDIKLVFGSPRFRQLKKVVLFERFSDTYDASFQGFPSILISAGLSEPVQTADPGVSEALAQASRDFQHLSACFIVDASPFFQALQPSWVWKQLTSLVLTSQILTPQQDQAVVNDFLQTAATAAMKMRKLESMELWNGTKGSACLFRYQSARDIRPAEVLWRGTWDLALRSRTVQAWESVARGQDAQCDFRVSKELLDTGFTRSHDKAIEQLGLLQLVMCPITK